MPAPPEWVDADRLIPKESDRVSKWPAVEEVTPKAKLRDRSAEFPPVLRHDDRDHKPIRVGAKSPQAAAEDAEAWIRQSLRPKWVPEGVARDFVYVQHEDPTKSAIFVKFAASDWLFQIGQMNTLMCIQVWLPHDAAVTPDLAGALGVLKEVCSNPESLHTTDVRQQAKLDGTVVYEVMARGERVPGFYLIWYVKGKELVIYRRDRLWDSQRAVLPSDPWF